MTRSAAASLRDDVASTFATDGPLARAWPGFERRDGQRDLAAEIAETLDRGGVLMAEAPTGLGKSLAYLVPSILLAARSGQRIVVATCTRSLQDQLFERDVPAVAAALGLTIDAVRLKGKQNYVCPRALDMAATSGDEEEEALEALRSWAADDLEGDLDRFPAPDPEAFQRLRGRVATDPDACTMQTCRRGRECCWVRARRMAGEARLLVVNHALLARAAEADGLLPEFDVLVIDEAHRLEDMLLSQLERVVSRHRFEELLRPLASPRGRRRSGLVARIRSFTAPLARIAEPDAVDDLDALAAHVPECREAVEALFEKLELGHDSGSTYSQRARHHSAEALFHGDLDPLERVLQQCTALATLLRRLSASLGSSGSPAAAELATELEQLALKWTGLGAELLALCEASRRDWVYWRTGSATGVQLRGSPVTAGELARRLVIDRARATVLTSATLTTAGDFGFTAQRLGLGVEGDGFTTSLQPSPFALDLQMRAYVLDGAGDREADTVAGIVAELAAATGRNQLVLFTAHERLRRARRLLLERLPAGTPLLAQAWDGSVSRITDRFRGERGAILLGVQSLWEGVDFPGAELEIVVVAKLPFSVPDDPRVEARGERLREQGVDPFRGDAVPEAVLKFRQGIGRLIRRRDDRGVLVVCDPRLAAASYRAPFLDALPAAPSRFADPRALARDAAAFLDGSGEGRP